MDNIATDKFSNYNRFHFVATPFAFSAGYLATLITSFWRIKLPEAPLP